MQQYSAFVGGSNRPAAEMLRVLSTHVPMYSFSPYMHGLSVGCVLLFPMANWRGALPGGGDSRSQAEEQLSHLSSAAHLPAYVMQFTLAFSIAIGLTGLYALKRFFGRAPSPPIKAEYDFIICGGGASGSTLAARLSEDPQVSVLVLEAGADANRFFVNMPFGSGLMHENSFNWRYKTEPAKHCDGEVHEWAAGRVVGGGSSINQMLWVRGHPADFDLFEQQYGCEGWAWKDVLPYFQRAESFKGQTESNLRGTSGPVEVNVVPDLYPLSEVWLKACDESGLPENKDYNGTAMAGSCRSQVNIRASDGTRCGAAQAYLRPALTRPNLTVLTNALVSRVRIENGTAVGVNFRVHHGKVDHYVTARREVILSAGAYGTPKILQLSGVGPSEVLKPLNIPIVTELPVGRNLQDHVMVPLFFSESKKRGATFLDAVLAFLNPVSLMQFYLKGKGICRWNVVEVMAFARTKLGQANLFPDMQLHAAPTAPWVHAPGWGYRPHFSWPTRGMYVMPTLLHPKSRNVCKLHSTDPLDCPVFENNFLENEEDLEVLLEGVKLSRQISSAPAFEGTVTEVRAKGLSGDIHSDEYTRAYIRKFTRTLFHPVGSCRMGPANNADTVVTPDLRVKGLKNLRVVDLSILPELTSGNTNAVAIMVGEKAHEIITAGGPASAL